MWKLGFQMNLHERVLCASPKILQHLKPGDFNWLFNQSLELTANPMDWLSVAEEKSKNWVCVWLNHKTKAKLSQTEVLEVAGKFTGDQWLAFVFSIEHNRFFALTDGEGVAASSGLTPMLVFVRKEGNK